jgi:hypothetical protein
VLTAVQHAIASGVGTVFRWSLPIILLGFSVAFFLKEIPLREDVPRSGTTVEGMEEASRPHQQSSFSST